MGCKEMSFQKGKKVWAALAAALLLFLAELKTIAKRAFEIPKPRRNLTFAIPEGPQYQKERTRMMRLIERAQALPFQFVHARSADGLTLSARLYKGKSGEPVAICFHGYKSSAVRDFAGGLQILTGQGCTVLLVDQRAQNDSEGTYITFGVKEKDDVFTWIDFVREHFGKDVPILLYGISMGGTTVLLSSGDKRMPGNVRYIVADCPFRSAKSIMIHVLEEKKMPKWAAKALYQLVDWSGFLFGHFRLSESDAAEAVRHCKAPVLIIHGEDDRFVPAEESEAIQKANPRKVRRETFPKAGHGISFILDQERYEALIKETIRAARNGRMADVK